MSSSLEAKIVVLGAQGEPAPKPKPISTPTIRIGSDRVANYR
jgi:hypothetical protein